MRERPILFSSAMVRAILDGQKTQTRRVVKPVPDLVTSEGVPARFTPRDAELGRLGVVITCPHGQPGDRLWVKETWRPNVAHGCAMGACDCADVNIEYAADGEVRYVSDYTINDANPQWCLPKAAARGNVSPLFMPRWASRLTLEITDIGVERLQDISEEDAIAEGIDGPLCAALATSTPWVNRLATVAVHAYAALWNQLNGAGAWDANPWVWVIGFKRVQA